MYHNRSVKPLPLYRSDTHQGQQTTAQDEHDNDVTDNDVTDNVTTHEDRQRHMSLLDLTQLYMDNMEVVYSHNAEDIQRELQRLDISKLTSLYKVLLESVLQTFPSYRDRRPIQRQMTRTIVPDIIWLGYSLVNKSPAKDMDKFLIRPNSESIDNILPNDDTNRMTASLQDLLVVVADLKNKVIKHDSEIGVLQELSSTLQSQIYLTNDKCNALSTELDQLRCCQKTLTREPANSVAVTQSSPKLHESAALHSKHQSGNESAENKTEEAS